MKKRGDILPEETLNIIVSLLCILLLLGLLAAIYFSNVKSKKLAEASDTLERISLNIDRISVNSLFIGEEYDIKPFGWTIFSYADESLKPNQCSYQPCLCICDKVNYDSLPFDIVKDRQVKECSNDGVCLIIENLNEFDEISITKGSGSFTSIRIEEEVSGKIGVRKI